MAVDRQRLAEALAYGEQKRRLMESVPTVGNLPPAQPARRSRRTDLENLSSGLGRGIVNQLEGVKGLVTDPVGTVKGAYEGVKGIVRDPSVLADALRYTADKAMSGPLGAGEVIGEMVGPMRGKPPMAEIDVYHGSPHVFDEFDASKIGTGEGAQAYGHGIYLAENPDVAKGYQKQLAQIKPEMTVEFGLPITEKSKKFAETALQSSNGDVDSAIKNLRENLQFYSSVEAKDAATEAINALKTAKITWGKDYPIGHFYTADLPDEMVDRMLDWDKPLSEQPEFVQKAWADWRNSPQAQKLMKQMGSRGLSAQDLEKTFGNPTGAAMHKWIYEGFGSSKGGEMPKVAQFLKDKGLVGVKYQDAGSRGLGGGGTRNFVVFPGEEKKVKILERNGEKLATVLEQYKPTAPKTSNVVEFKAKKPNPPVKASPLMDDWAEKLAQSIGNQIPMRPENEIARDLLKYKNQKALNEALEYMYNPESDHLVAYPTMQQLKKELPPDAYQMVIEGPFWNNSAKEFQTALFDLAKKSK